MRKKTFNSSPLESNLVNKVKTFIKNEYKRNGWLLKTAGNASQRSGIPDILCCINGKFIAIETKREDGSGRPSEQQLIECKKIDMAGGHAIISDNFDEIKNFIKSVAK